MIEDMKDMMTERLLLYKKKNKVLPEKVILFRDGVSEGQFDLVLQHELPEIEKAFVAVYGAGAALPKLSIVICGKRHHARPLPTSAETASDNGNTRPGTVVDKGITDVYRYDFYLQVSAIGLSRQRGADP
jgi:eukaryotic translation initiation factor 2C